MIKNKKALSEMIGYILLITMAIAISVIAYAWLRTYVPKDKLECPSDVSILIKSLNCNSDIINLKISNNGLFSVAGIIAKYGIDENQLATGNLNNNLGGRIYLYDSNETNENKFENAMEYSQEFVKPENIAIVEITPIMFVLDENSNKEKLAICGNSKARERVQCS